ncbi:hypothetical protein M514_28448 [Trichuris suis]|uniref:Uncharacterized protein n=1 Tax=Trichuris suis TaxID=68888 RepID=A0A085MQ77_9BILA|nr:hypothetical protein M514_28448 [Trichuris suis]
MFVVPCKKTKKLCRYGLSKMQDEFGLQWYGMKTENTTQALDQSVTSLIDSKPENQERYSIFCEKRRKNKNIISIIFASILLIGGISAGVALSVAAGATLGIFVIFCIAANGMFAIGAALYNRFAE